jgi:hypothetical protein
MRENPKQTSSVEASRRPVMEKFELVNKIDALTKRFALLKDSL